MEFQNGAIIKRDYRNIKHIDRDDYDYYMGTAVSIPEKYQADTSWLTVNFQKNTPECSAHSGTHCKAILDSIFDKINRRLAPVFLWRIIKKSDNLPPEVGATIESIFKGLRSDGICDWDLLPTDFNITENERAYGQLTKEQLENAQPKIIKSYAITYNPSFETSKEIIFKDKVAILLLRFDGSWWSGSIHETNGSLTYGHFVCAYGYDKDYIYVIDSADAINPYKKIGKNFKITAIGSAVDLPDEYVKSLVKQRSLLQKIVELYRQLSTLLKR